MSTGRPRLKMPEPLVNPSIKNKPTSPGCLLNAEARYPILMPPLEKPPRYSFDMPCSLKYAKVLFRIFRPLGCHHSPVHSVDGQTVTPPFSFTACAVFPPCAGAISLYPRWNTTPQLG